MSIGFSRVLGQESPVPPVPIFRKHASTGLELHEPFSSLDHGILQHYVLHYIMLYWVISCCIISYDIIVR